MVEQFGLATIPFGMISKAVQHTIDAHADIESPTLDDLMEADHWARKTAETYVHSRL